MKRHPDEQRDDTSHVVVRRRRGHDAQLPLCRGRRVTSTGRSKRSANATRVGDYKTLKETCDRYFYIKHRHEMRGVGGIFFDELSPVGAGDFDTDFAFVEDGVRTLEDAYLPVLKKRKDTPYGERERRWQLMRRGRYAEFNLVYDRGTTFGLQTGGHIEAILMSLPPYAHWVFDYQPEAGSPEAEMLTLLQPRDWVGFEVSR